MIQYGCWDPELQRTRGRASGESPQTTSMTVGEKNWKDHSEIHSASRNRLAPSKARDLVFVATSLRLHEHVHKIEMENKRGALAFGEEDLTEVDEEEVEDE